MCDHVKYLQASLLRRVDRYVQGHSCIRHASLCVHVGYNISMFTVAPPSSLDPRRALDLRQLQ